MKPGRLLIALALLTPVALAAEPAGTTLPWNTLGCSFAYATVEVPAARLAALMPPNWRPYALNGATANTLAELTFEADDCAEGSGVAEQVSPMQYASTWTPVIPPPSSNVGIFTVMAWDVLVPDAARREILASDGAPVVDGEIRFGADLAGGMPATPFAIDYTLEGIGDFRIDVVPLRDLGPSGVGEFAQYTRAPDASGPYWRTKWQADTSYQGVALVTLPEGSWQAEALGSTHVPARVNFGTWDYFDGKIVLAH